MKTQTTRWGERGRHDNPADARERILAATYRALLRYGIQKTTISEIAKQASVSRPTIYRYFDNREDIIRSLLVARRDAFFEAMYEATRPYGGDFHRLIEECLRFADKYQTGSGATGDMVSGPNARAIQPYLGVDGTLALWRRILEPSYREYVKQTGNRLNLDDLAAFLGHMILLNRNYRIDGEPMVRQLRAVMALGRGRALRNARSGER